MPLMWKENAGYLSSSGPNMHFLTEDPRPGHNVMYFGQGKNAFDSVSLKPLWGLEGTFKYSTSGSSYYGGAWQLRTANSNHYFNKKAYMYLAGSQPMGYGKNEYTTTVTNGQTWVNVHANAFMNMDNEQRTTQHFVKDNGDGTHTLYINAMEHGNSHDQYYAEGYYYQNIPNDLELYEVGPDYRYSTTSTASYRGVPTAYTALDGTNSGFMVLSMNMGSYPQYANITMHRINNSTVIESAGLSTSNAAGYYAQFAGMSRADGLPIFFEYRHSLNTPFFRVTKYNGSAFTTLFSNYNTSAGQQRHRYLSTGYSYAQSLSASNYDYNAGTSDSFMTLASSWFRGAGHTSNYYFSIVPTSYAGMPYCDVIRWDRSTDTFVGAGYNGASTDYATAYHYDNGYNGWYTGGSPNWSTLVETPLRAASVAGSNVPTSSGHSGTEQALAYAVACDAHGFASADGSTESPFETEDYPGGGDVMPITFMNMTGVDGAFDARAQGRVLFCTTQDVTNANYLNGFMQARSVTQIPETVIDWVWCDSGKTTIAAICKNATYIYQCRKGASLTDGSATGNRAYPNASGDLNTSTFNVEINASAIAWVHTATIPYQVLQMGIDKHDRLWYITYSAAGPYYQSSSTNDSYYHKQMWMLTTATPHKVNLTGNATTDTISYSGSNIDKTLTIEALNFKGQRLAKTITLNITSTNAQFDNGSQTKDVTTSASATVNETITVTGAGSFNITAAYGA